jgi:hypothetical protein
MLIVFMIPARPVYAQENLPPKKDLDEIDQPGSPDAFPVMQGRICTWGATSCNPCAYDVVETFATLRTHGDVMGFNLGSHPDPEGIFKNHWQGIQRVTTGDGKYLVVTRDTIEDASGNHWSGFAIVNLYHQPSDGNRFHLNRLHPDVWNRWVKPAPEDTIVATELITTAYDHPGGIQATGNLLAVGTGNQIYFYDLANRYNPQRLTTEIHRPNRTGSSTSLTLLQDGRYLLIVAHSDASVLDFYVSNSGFPDEVDGFTHFDEWWPFELWVISPPPNGWSPESEYTFWQPFQSINLVTECGTGDLYLVGTGFTGVNSSRIFGSDWVYLYKLIKSPNGDYAQITMIDAAHKFCSSLGATNCNFDAAAGIYVDYQGNLNLLSTEHWNYGPGDSIKMAQFRSQNSDSCYSNEEAWVELFEHDNFRGRSLLIDYTDRNFENYENFKMAEDFEDKVSSVRWCLPPELTFTLYIDKNPCRGMFRLTGDEYVQEIPNLHDDGYGDRFSCAKFFDDPPVKTIVDPFTGKIISYSFPLQSHSLHQLDGVNATPSITVEVPPLDIPEPIEIEIKPVSPPAPSYYIPAGISYAGYGFDLIYDNQPYVHVPFSDPFKVTFQYDDADIGDVPEGNLMIYGEGSTISGTLWMPVDQLCPGIDTNVQHNLAQDVISANICQSGKYGLYGEIPPTSPKWLLFDEAHTNWNSLSWTRAVSLSNYLPWHPDPEWLYFGDLEPELADIVDFVIHESGPITKAKLELYDILMITAPENSLSAEEIRDIRSFVHEGGGLVVMADCGTSSGVEGLLSAYGIHMDNVCVYVMETDPNNLNGDVEMVTFNAHPAANNVSLYMGNWGHSMQLDSPAEWLVSTFGKDVWLDENDSGSYDADEEGAFITGATYDQGCGRVVALGDESFNHAFFAYDNETFIRSILEWVSGGQYCSSQPIYLPMLIR